MGRFAGWGGPTVEGVWPGFLAAGMRMVLTENDLSLLMRGGRDRVGFFSELVSGLG